MTQVYLTNNVTEYPDYNGIQATKYYIEIYGAKIETDYIADITFLPYPTQISGQGDAPITYALDLQKRAKSVTITGYIDKYSNRASNWAADVVHDAGVVKQRMEWMFNRGAMQKLYSGTAADGYYDLENSGVENCIIIGKIIRLKFTETGGDHIDRTSNSEDYPSATKEIVEKYEIIISIREAIDM